MEPDMPPALSSATSAPTPNVRFVDRRGNYLVFVNTTNEKDIVAGRVAAELDNIEPRTSARALRVFDAGTGDGSVLTQTMAAMHDRFENVPFYVVGKEISVEDVRLVLQKVPDRFVEHPATVLVLTNLAYADAAGLSLPKSSSQDLVWKEVALTGNTSHKLRNQIHDLEPFLTENWKIKISPKTGNPLYETPTALVIFHEDYRFMLDSVIPHKNDTKADYDLVIASQPYRARNSLEFKAQRVIAPLARALGPGGRLIGVHSQGNDPGHEIIQGLWPGENPFIHTGQQIIDAVKHELTGNGRTSYEFKVDPGLLRYNLRPLSDSAGSIGTSALYAAWNAATYVAQVDDGRIHEATRNGALDVTRDVLNKHSGKLWFNDTVFTIRRGLGD